MGKADYYQGGNWNSICDACGKKFKFSDLKKRWDGIWVCHQDWEIRHPQDFLKGIKDNQSVPVSRPEAPDTFTIITATYPLVDGFAVDTLLLG